MSYLLDTNVISEIRKGQRCHPAAREWFSAVRATELYLSVLVVGEIRKGVERLRGRDPDQAAVFDAWLGELGRDFADRIIPVTRDIAEIWGQMSAATSVPVIDGLMAATAQARDLILVTRNVSDVASTDVRMINPFDE